MGCVRELLAAHADQPHHSRLVEAFQGLTPSTLPLNAHNRYIGLQFWGFIVQKDNITIDITSMTDGTTFL